MARKVKNIFLFLFLIYFCFKDNCFAWNDCPYGRKNDPFPGFCGLYIDSNKDNFCDHSQILPQKNITNLRINNSFAYFIIFIFSSMFYLFTLILYKNKRLSLLIFRRIWNGILFFSFLITSLSSFLILFNNFFANLFNLKAVSVWHNAWGIITIFSGIIHLGWHWDYYKKIFYRKK